MKKPRRQTLTALALALMVTGTTHAQLGLKVTVNVEEAGTLFVKIMEQIEEVGELTDVTELTVSGQLNDDDKNVLRNQTPNLVRADFSNVAPECAKYILLRDHKHLVSCVLPTEATELGNDLFYRCDSLVQIVLPPNLTTIPQYFAEQCKLLASIDIPATVTSIKNNAFARCPSFTAFTLPDSLKEIGNAAFYECTGLTSMTIPVGVTKLNYELFCNCRNLTSINILSPEVTIAGSVFYDTGFETFTLPEGAIIDGSYAFAKCANLKSFTFPDGLTTEKQVGTYTFSNCPVLESVRLPQDLTVMPSYMFSGSGLAQLDLPASVTTLKEYALSGMKQLKSIQIPATVTTMERCVFWGSGLESFDWPAHLTTIPSETFRSCENLQSINIPATVDSIENGIFNSCTQLRSLHLPEGIRTISGALCYHCDSLREVTIPQTVTYIDRSAFERTNLHHVDIPDGVTYIGWAAIQAPLEDLKLPSSLKHIGGYAFSDSRATYRHVVVPEGVMSMGSRVFYSDSLRVLDLPSTLAAIYDYPIGDNYKTKLDSLIIRAATPPLRRGTLFNNENRHCRLFVPRASVSLYQADSGYNIVDSIGGLDINVGQLTVTTQIAVTPGSSLGDGKYDVKYLYVYYGGYEAYSDDHPRMSVEKGATFHAGRFTMPHDLNLQRGTYRFETFINRGTFTVDDIDLQCHMYGRHIFTPPFDIAYDDLRMHRPGSPFAFYRYDSEARAAAKFDNTWVKVKPGETLHAGQAYCFRSDRVLSYDKDGNLLRDRYGYPEKEWDFLHMKPMKGGADYFSTADDVTLPLQHYAAEFPHNANWNAVGMPYPAYLDIRGLDYDGPIIVWNWGQDFNMYDDMWYNNGTWQAYSPLDDEVVLIPMQAFFIQAPDSVNSLTFDADRRQNNGTFVKGNTQNSRIALRRADQQRNRVVYNATLSRSTQQEEGQEVLDHTRFVVNPAATLRYDIGRDAPKMSDADGPVNLLYTMANGMAYAINERPLADGIIRLGLQTAEAGTYTLSLSIKNDNGTEVWLIDNDEHTRTLLSEESYTFSVGEAGTSTSRFIIALGGADPTAITDVEEVLPLRSEGLYNLAGMRVSTPQKGIFIENGRKVIK